MGNILGKRIALLREEKRLNQIELAKLLNISNTTLSQYEAGNRTPSNDIMRQIADYFNVSVDYLLGRTNVRNFNEIKNKNDKITNAVNEDPDLLAFWEEMKERENLQLLFKQARTLNDKNIKQIIRIIKAIEDEEDREER